MTRDEKFRIKRRINRRAFMGDASLLLKVIALAAYLVGLLYVWSNRENIAALSDGKELISPVMEAVLHHCTAVYLLAAGVGLACLLAYPFGKRMAEDQLTSIGLVNHAGMAPELRRKHRDPEHPNVTIWTFRNRSIPLIVWENQRPAIEAALVSPSSN